jgi:hypothetical protein
MPVNAFIEAMREIESPEFSLRLNYASSLKLLLRAAGAEAAVKNAFSYLVNSRDDRRTLLNRLIELSHKPPDSRENPHDAAMVVFLWLLLVTDRNEDVSDPTISLALSGARELNDGETWGWWSTRLATKIVGREQYLNTSGITKLSAVDRPIATTVGTRTLSFRPESPFASVELGIANNDAGLTIFSQLKFLPLSST